MGKAFLIAAPWSNSGKTTITLGLLKLLKNKGYNVQPFKCGPDYIDTIHHSTAAGTPSVNLDSIMMSDTHLKEVFLTYTSKVEISIIEGVMGLFDGAVKDKGSSAEIAKKLDVPVILVVNAKSMAYTVAPILQGLKNFDKGVHIAGVIFNFVRTESHYAFLKEACDKVGLESLGYIPPNDAIAIPSRHLGLHIDTSFEDLIEKAAKHVDAHLEVNQLLEIASKGLKSPDINSNDERETKEKINGFQPIALEEKSRIKNNGLNPIDIEERVIKVAVAKDEAFTFTYLENLNYLKTLGEVVFFSPIHDNEVPKADIIYLAGGYPELYLEQLSKNTTMLQSIKKAAEEGIKILGECGGMMYLGKSIIDEKGTAFPMANIFNFSTTMEQKKLSLGYRKVVFNNEEIWGHEFHYSKVLNDEDETSVASIFTAREKKVTTKLYQYKNVFASYIHFYWAGNSMGFYPIDISSSEEKLKINGFQPIALEDELTNSNNGLKPIDLTQEYDVGKGLKSLDEGTVEHKEYYFITFTTAKSRISDRMVKYNSSKFIKEIEAFTFQKNDLEKMTHLFKEAIEKHEIDIDCFNVLPDHAHLLLKVKDEEELNNQIKKLKGYTSFIFQRYKEWEKGTQKVWAQKYHKKQMSKIDASLEEVTSYIRNNHYKHEERWGKEMTEFIASLYSK